MQASFTLSQCVKRCQQDCTRDGSLTLIRKNSRLDIIDLSVLRIWSFFFNQKTKPECKIKSFFTSGKQKKKSTALMWMVIVITVRQCSKQWDVTTTSVLVKKLVPP